MRTYAIRRVVALAALALLSITPGMAAEPFVEVLPDAPLTGAEQQLRRAGDDVDWVRRVRVNEVALAADEITVDLHDMVLHLVRDPSEPLFESVQSVIYRPACDEGAQREVRSIPGMQWVGRVKTVSLDVEGKPGPPPYVRIWSDASGAHARFSQGFWRYALDGDRLVKRDVRRALRDERDDVRDRRPDRPAPDLPPGIAAAGSAEGRDVIRVAYGFAAGALADGLDPAIEQVRAAVIEANAGFAASGIELELQTAANALPGYRETTLDQTLDDIAKGRQGPLWLLHVAREGERADVMVMIIDTHSGAPACGLAQQVLATRETAFLAVERRCLDHHTLAHEMGHLLGADHDPENAALDPPRFAYGHGYQFNAEDALGWRTVMALECGDRTCPRVNIWSSPLIQHEGVPTGSADLHDNARVLRETKGIVASFYPDPPSHDPDVLDAAAMTSSRLSPSP
ncbi:M12 family metallo-peptidase [Stenotrophomonas sp. GD03958]|uniref:M12 family metallo-peptidase n=1 Tax=Stenotrophomonas sp. GD03958 TaxID=2975411 RepID=UPI002036D544|nr:M12 family metallo-peptidase [Stenotrophomonas sp. GD03958]MCM2526459.1 M12 family metallo-peptidase [Stenotrophomonas maltophilia]MDH1195396.1 M12 family metallo-peptidase [Stenotrophomonas sp. GD03958]